jgi:hypothetical protein
VLQTVRWKGEEDLSSVGVVGIFFARKHSFVPDAMMKILGGAS